MPSGACTALEGEEWEKVKEAYFTAASMGMELEWLQWFVGGLVINKLKPTEAAWEAMLEWDL